MNRNGAKAFFDKIEMRSMFKVIIVPSKESKVRIGVQPHRPCLHHLGVWFGCQRDVDEIASQGKHGTESWPQIRLGRSRLRKGTTIGHSVIKAADVGCPPETETNGVKGVGSIGL